MESALYCIITLENRNLSSILFNAFFLIYFLAILPAANNWDDGVLLPASFVFEHHLNKNNSPHVYVDIIVSDDRAPHVEVIETLRKIIEI